MSNFAPMLRAFLAQAQVNSKMLVLVANVANSLGHKEIDSSIMTMIEEVSEGNSALVKAIEAAIRGAEDEKNG